MVTPEEPMLTPSELAKLADVPRQMIFNYIGAGRLEGVRTENGWRIRKTVADAWLLAREVKAKAKLEEIQRQLRGEK